MHKTDICSLSYELLLDTLSPEQVRHTSLCAISNRTGAC